MLKKLVKLATPIALVNLGHMSLQVTDLVICGRVSPRAVASVGTGSSMFAFVMVVGFGILAGLDTLVSQAWGRKDVQTAWSSYVNALIFSLLYAIPASLVLMLLGRPLLELIGSNAEILDSTVSYLTVLAPSLIPLLIFQSGRQFLQSIGHERIGMYIMVAGIVLNAGLDYILVLGWGPIQGMGATGAALATLVLRLAMAVSVWLWIRRRFPQQQISYDRSAFAALMRIGVPAAVQMLFEVGAFASATLIVSRLSPAAVAAHQIVLNIASLTFMVPLGLASAGAVLVGQSFGAEEFEQMKLAGRQALLAAAGFMSVSAVAFFLFPIQLISLYSESVQIHSAAMAPLFIAAAFQLFDGIQVVAAGILRGIGKSRESAVANGLGHWCIGLPLGVALAFGFNLGLIGIWIGLATGLMIVAVALVWVWQREIVKIVAKEAAR